MDTLLPVYQGDWEAIFRVPWIPPDKSNLILLYGESLRHGIGSTVTYNAYKSQDSSTMSPPPHVSYRPMNIKSKQRVAAHGEVFTPAWMVEAMLDLVKDESERIDSRFLEPACGSGNFLVQVLRRKLAAVELKFGKSEFEKRHYALLGIMCIYGIELLDDNVAECHKIMLEVLADYIGFDEQDDFCRAAAYVLSENIVHGDALTM